MFRHEVLDLTEWLPLHREQLRQSAVFFPINSQAIKSFLDGNWENLFRDWHRISEFQYQYFQEMITPDFMRIWQDGLEKSHFKLKLCGAGGGGFILGITNNFQLTQQKINNYQLLKI